MVNFGRYFTRYTVQHTENMHDFVRYFSRSFFWQNNILDGMQALIITVMCSTVEQKKKHTLYLAKPFPNTATFPIDKEKVCGVTQSKILKGPIFRESVYN